MSRKLAVSFLLVFLGLATWDVFLERNDSSTGSTFEGRVRTFDDGVPPPPRP